MSFSMSEPSSQRAEPLMDLIRRLYPICRSITGDGVRRTLEEVRAWLPLEMHEVPTGTQAFDWTVPNEWNIRDACIETMDGQRVVDFQASSLHVLNYSCPVDTVVDRETLDEHLNSLPEHPDRIPYRTSYYTERWGFCLTHRQREALREPRYRVKVDATLEPGSLTYGECLIPGRESREVLIYTHVCHPSLCNDNLSGIAVAAALGRALAAQASRRFSYRLVFAPGTIGSIVWLSRNQARLGRIAHGLVLGLLGDAAPHTYKRTRAGDREVDRIVEHVLERRPARNEVLDFSPYGYDERQFGSPGINLPVGRLTRSVNGGYPEYHTSADNLELVSESRLEESVELVLEILDALEHNRRYVNLSPCCEPQLGKRGLYRSTGGEQIEDRESAMLWVLNQSDGEHSLLDIARKSGIKLESLAHVAAELVEAELLQQKPEHDQVEA